MSEIVKIKALLWDIDVCLVDTHLARERAQKEFLLCCNIAQDKINEIITHWNRLFWYFDQDDYKTILQVLRKEFQCEDKITDERIQFAIDNFSILRTGIVLMSGARDVLDFCIAHQIPFGIISNGNEAFQWKKLHLLDLEKYFPIKERVVVMDSTHGKPLPDGILECCKTIEIVPQKTAFVGDRKSDIIAANLAGCMSIQFMAKAPEAREPEDEILDIEKPTMKINDLREILPLLQ